MLLCSVDLQDPRDGTCVEKKMFSYGSVGIMVLMLELDAGGKPSTWFPPGGCRAKWCSPASSFCASLLFLCLFFSCVLFLGTFSVMFLILLQNSAWVFSSACLMRFFSLTCRFSLVSFIEVFLSDEYHLTKIKPEISFKNAFVDYLFQFRSFFRNFKIWA